MERLFINNNFHYVKVVTLSNGSGWTVDALCNQIATKYKVSRSNPDHIVVWLDMEKQSCSTAQFRSAIRDKLLEIGVEESKIAVCVPNRMTENIILADEEVIRSELNADFVYDHEGQNGKVVLKTLHEAVGKSYREMFHGVTLLKKVRLQRAANKSPCCKEFLADLPLSCWWF